MREPKAHITSLLQRFLSGQDRSVGLAGELETAIATLYPEHEDWEEFLHALASYKPGGGPYLYDEEAMLPKCRWALAMIGTHG